MMAVKLDYGCSLKEAKERGRFERLRNKNGENREGECTAI